MNFREQLHKARFGPQCNFGKSSSTSASTNTTNNVSTTTTQDRRVVADSGAGVVNADNSTVGLTVNSTTTDMGAVTGGLATANNAVNQSSSAFQHLADVGAQMLNANTSLANSINTSGMNTTLSLASDMTQLFQGVLQGAAKNQDTASQLALQPAAQQNPDRYLLLGALAIVAVVAFQHKGA
jgi:hypothetical protein